MHIHVCISIAIHSLLGHVLRCTIILQCTRIYVHMFQIRAQFLLCNYILPNFAEIKVLQQQNMLNLHHLHTLVCTVCKWNYEQHLHTHTLIPMVNIFASTNVPLSYQSHSLIHCINLSRRIFLYFNYFVIVTAGP